MERDGKAYLSNNYTRTDYWRLDLNNSSFQDWNTAIHFFRERIYGRYVHQIDMLNENPFENGFASVSLCCLVIDCMYKFEHGTDGTSYNKVKYKEMLREHMGDVFCSDEAAETFYNDIRCGILHSGETQNGSQLTVGNSYVIKMSSTNDQIRVDVVNFAERVKAYIREYCERLYSNDRKTRKNFRRKMRYLRERPQFRE